MTDTVNSLLGWLDTFAFKWILSHGASLGVVVCWVDIKIQQILH